jgi:hypothetical protein
MAVAVPKSRRSSRELISAPRGTQDRRVAARLERGALIATELLPAPLIVYLGVNSGGYPRGITGVGAGILGLLLGLRAVLAPRTVRRPGAVGLVMVGALLGLAAWQLLSAGWSGSATRAIAEFDRTTLYLLAVLTFVTLPRRSLRTVLLSVAAGVAVLAVLGLVTRVRPDLFPITQNAAPERLAFPITYWNAMGMVIACGLVLCLHAAAELTGPRWARIAGAGLFPALASTLYLTLSRGGLGAAVAGLALYVVIARPRGLLPAALAIALPTFLLASEAYDATALISSTPTSTEAVIQGKELATAALVWCFVAALARAALTRLDPRLHALKLPSLPRSRRALVLAWVAAALVAGALVAGAPGLVQDQYDRFVKNAPTSADADPRGRLTEIYNAGRISHWDVALDASRGDRLTGLGAGTFDQMWYRDRPSDGLVTEAHNLYVETLSELGIVGAVLLGTFILAMLAAAITRRRRRAVAGAVMAIVAAWAMHAAIDWDWEVPAVTLVPIVAAAAAAAVPAQRSHGRRRWTPGVVGVAALALAAVPTVNALAQTSIGDAQSAYDSGDCSSATERAERARSLLPMLPEPHALLALCALRDDRPEDALRLSRRAVTVDPKDWEWRFLDALVIGTTGGDPRGQLREAVRLNPRGVAPASLRDIYRETPRAVWPLRSVQAYVWMGGSAHSSIRE